MNGYIIIVVDVVVCLLVLLILLLLFRCRCRPLYRCCSLLFMDDTCTRSTVSAFHAMSPVNISPYHDNPSSSSACICLATTSNCRWWRITFVLSTTSNCRSSTDYPASCSSPYCRIHQCNATAAAIRDGLVVSTVASLSFCIYPAAPAIRVLLPIFPV